MNVKTPKVDRWIIKSATNGLQITKNDKNIRFTTSFEKAWQFVTDQGTPGDKIDINVIGELSVS